MRPIAVAIAVFALIVGTVTWVAAEEAPLDPVTSASLPCEALATPGLLPRSAKNLAHVANVCGFVGTDIEFQSRRAADGSVHDYAFVVDGREWVPDPYAPGIGDGFGGINSRLTLLSPDTPRL